MLKIFVVKNTLNGCIIKAFRNEKKAHDYRSFLDPPIQRPVHAVDEVDLDEELPEEVVGPPHSVRLVVNVSAHVRVGEVLGVREGPEGGAASTAAQVQSWVIATIAKALGDSFQKFEHVSAEVFDEQGRRIDR